MKIAVLIANGSEEMETVTPIDVLRRAKADCDLVSVGELTVRCSRGVLITADKVIDDLNFEEYDGVVIPGGMNGAINISDSEKAVAFIRALSVKRKLVAAICAAPAVVLAKNGLLKNKKITCFPSDEFIEEVKKNNFYTAKEVQTEGNVITADGPKSALRFSLEICSYLGLEPAI